MVAPPVNGIRELIGADEAGLIARRDAGDLGRALGELASDPVRRARMGAVARKRASCFDEDVVAGRILALYESLLG